MMIEVFTHLEYSMAAEQTRFILNLDCTGDAMLIACSLRQHRRRLQWLVKGVMRHRGDILLVTCPWPTPQQHHYFASHPLGNVMLNISYDM